MTPNDRSAAERLREQIITILHAHECDEEPLPHDYTEHLPEDEPEFHPNRVDVLVEWATAALAAARREGAQLAVREIRGRLFEAAWRQDGREWLDPKVTSDILDAIASDASVPEPPSEAGGEG